jgi:acyl homoserine lactone synthase
LLSTKRTRAILKFCELLLRGDSLTLKSASVPYPISPEKQLDTGFRQCTYDSLKPRNGLLLSLPGQSSGHSASNGFVSYGQYFIPVIIIRTVMIHFIDGNAATLGTLRDLMGRFRYEVLVNEEKWSLPDVDHSGRIEFDQFDTADAIYVIAVSSDGKVRGCARLAPTTQPNLLMNVFPALLTLGIECASAHMWELSRLVVRSGDVDGNAGLAQTLFSQALDIARANGAKLVVGVVSPSMERFYRRHGYAIRRIGSTIRLADGSVTACAIDTDPILRHANTRTQPGRDHNPTS